MTTGTAIGFAPLSLEEDFLVTVFNVARIGICFTDENACFVQVNPAFCDMVGYRPEELIGRHYTLAAPPMAVSEAERFYKALLKDSPRVPQEWQIRRKDGTQFDALASFKPLTRTDGRRFVVITFTDITERKLAEGKVRELNQELEHRIDERTSALVTANERIRRLIETANDAVITMDLDSVILDWNGRAEEIFGWRREEAIGCTVMQTFLPERYHARHHRALASFRDSGHGGVINRTAEIVLRRRDGSEFDAELSVWPVRSGDAFTFSSFARDISERKRHEAALAARAEQIILHRNVLLELAQLDKSDFEAALQRILRAACDTLGLDNVAYWTLAPDGSAITCEMVYRANMGGIDPAGRARRFDAQQFPAYFASVQAHRNVIASHAWSEPVLADFVDVYLKPTGIRSLMDLGVWLQGRMVGLLCLNHVGPPREWTAEEIDFATAIGNMVSLALEGANRQHLMEALAKSEEKYRHVVENANEGILVVQDGCIRFANPKTEELFGYALERLQDAPLERFLHPDDRARIIGNHYRRISGKAVENHYPFRIVDSGGQVKWLQINAVVFDWEGRRATLNFLADITERRRLQENLKQTMAEQETILETATVGIAFLVDRRIKWINQRLEQHMYGYERGELVGRDTRMLYADPEDYRRTGREAYPLLTQGRTYECEVCMRRRDGTEFWVNLSGRAVNPQDLDQGSIWILTDISESRRLQQNLTQTLIEREAILRSTLVGITFSIGRRHRWVNDTFARMLGYEPEDLIGQLSNIHFPDQKSWEEFGRTAYPILGSGAPYAGELQMKRKDGQLIWCQLYGQAIDPGDLNQGTIWTFVDVTERKRAEEETRRALERERELNELKSRFVSMTSHEFRTPLATILSSTELLDDYGERLPPAEKAELMELIKSAVNRMAQMLDDVLTIGKADSERVQFNPRPLDLGGFCTAVMDDIRRSDRNAHRLEFELRGDATPRLLDDNLLRHILTNLLDNAVKYSAPGTPVCLSIDCLDQTSVFEVRDQGIGIPPEDRAHLFDTFQRGKNVRNVSGTGLGLAIVRKMVDLHGGTVSFESEVGYGTRFIVTLPSPAVNSILSWSAS